MHQALHRIVGDAAAIRERAAIDEPRRYVGFKMAGILACSIYNECNNPSVALAYAERLRELLRELVTTEQDERLCYMILDTDRVIAELSDAEAAEAVRRLVG